MTSQTFKSAIVQGSLFLPGIHGLRGVAALAVILYHLVKIVGLNPPDFFGFIGRDFGYGVQLFFVISAFSLCCSTEKFIQQSTWTVEYFIKRFFRIAPLFYFMLAFEVSRQFLTDGVVTTSLSNILLNLTFTFGFAPPFSSIVWAGWTIGVEMIFYAIFPVLLLTIRTHRAAFIFLVLSILVSCCMRYELYMQLKNLTILEKSLNVRLAFASNLCFFAMGIYAYQVSKLNKKPIFSLLIPLATILTLFLLMFLNLGNYLNGIIGEDIGRSCRWDAIIWGLGFAWLCIWQAESTIRFFANKFFVYLGERSFSIYLLHPVAIHYSKAYLLKIYESLTPIFGLYAFFICAALLIILILIFAEFTYRFIEVSGIGFGKKLIMHNRHKLALAK